MTPAKPTTTQRGYGAAHQRERRRWKPIVDRGDATCCLCHQPIEPGSKWHLDHTPDKRGYRGVAHAHCNDSEAQLRKQGRIPTPRPPGPDVDTWFA